MNKLYLKLSVAFTMLPTGALAQALPSSFVTAHRYDALRREVGTIAPDADGSSPYHYLATRNTYDASGRLITVQTGELSSWQSEAVAPSAWSGFAVFNQVDTDYDLMGRKLKVTVSSGGTPYEITQYSYDTVGRLECTAIRMNPATFGSLPVSACTPATPGNNGPDRITRNIYDAAGRVLQVQKAVGTSLEQAYVTYGYTTNGKQEYVVDANGNKARLVYDGHDRQVQWQFPSTSLPGGYDGSTPANALATSGAVNTNDYEAYDYDASGNRTSLRKRDGRSFTYGYDALNRMTSKIVPDACVPGYACTAVTASATRDVYYAYDLRGLQTAARFDSASGADAVTNTYDGFGRISSSATAMGGVSRTLGFLYDADGNRTRITHPDGNYFTYAYDGLDRPIDAYESGAYQRLHFDWDNQGHRWGEWRGAVFSSYGFDQISRLASIGHNLAGSSYDVTTSFGYNPASQIVSRARTNDSYAFGGYVNVDRSYTPNGLNQYAAVAGNNFTYDANGNLISDGAANYSYDAENRLVATSAGVALIYDPLGRLYQIYRSGVSDTRFLYDGDQLTVEYDGAGNLLRRYVHGTGEDDPMLWYEGATLADLRSMQVDHQGSVVSIADAGGNAVAVYRYDEYGIPGANQTGRFQYTGQAWIPELGMYYYKARIYSPTLGRFMQTDPIGYDDQVNLYAYVGNDPVNGRDPTGECTGTRIGGADAPCTNGTYVARLFVTLPQDTSAPPGKGTKNNPFAGQTIRQKKTDSEGFELLFYGSVDGQQVVMTAKRQYIGSGATVAKVITRVEMPTTADAKASPAENLLGTMGSVTIQQRQVAGEGLVRSPQGGPVIGGGDVFVGPFRTRPAYLPLNPKGNSELWVVPTQSTPGTVYVYIWVKYRR